MTLKCHVWMLLLAAMLFTGTNAGRCKVIPLSRCQIAASASQYVYGVNIKVGDIVTDTDDFKVTRIVTKVFNYKATTRSINRPKSIMVMVAENARTTIIAFRGTVSASQLLSQGLSAITDLLKPKKNDVWFGKKKVDVLSFFWGAFNMVFPGIKGKLLGRKNRNRKYIITGHSLGGALASVLALKLAVLNRRMWKNKDNSLITFGAPRVGNGAYAILHDQLIAPNKKIRFTYLNDPVPHIPLSIYRHHSREVFIGKFLFSSSFYIKVCKLKDPAGCSNDPTNIFNVLTNGLFSPHMIWKYKNLLKDPPADFYDMHDELKSSFVEAERSSC